MTFLLPLKLMDRNWDYDVPYYYEQVIDQKECNDICSWKDVEYCLNMPQFFDINVVSKHAIQKIDPPKYPRSWAAYPWEEKADLFQLFKEGHTFIINNYSFRSEKVMGMLDQWSSIFSGDSQFQIYCGKGKSNSFYIHEDLPNNFIVQLKGETHWRVFNERRATFVAQADPGDAQVDYDNFTPAIDVVLKAGDALYIPPRCYHQAQPSEERISLSIPLHHYSLYHAHSITRPVDWKWYKLN
ncbi:hypothetical protein PTIM40_52 [Cyanophage P-TIM40]|uniref:JmjC domain-containing protein n=1 Tax=Cyanophage P-TIM40 TaxID=1589733 RepID=A0A0C5AE43_9CAUD|nr:cupin-like domain-containing protein [Cyanophage P-TIM40]AJK27479.1 hypothetical protein PTIM40_52 [Cyanophage P-TIM40]